MPPSSQFLNLPKEKQDEILLASLREFAEKGFDLASTNEIVKQAGISKGVLFKYFEDKESLFIHVFETVLDAVMETSVHTDAATIDDVFEWFKRMAETRVQFFMERPLTYRLMMRALKDPQHPVYAKVYEYSFQFTNRFMAQLATELPMHKLREGMSWEKVFAIVTLISLGMNEKYFTNPPAEADAGLEEWFQSMMDEIDTYFDIVKYGAYKRVDTSKQDDGLEEDEQ
ncbi:TetR/AcrR family transcriptional regulator [Alicyclobacillus curvatus]|nr:TetR/AcrR family transcriptional regulator [Alicyclobacillus curvatus]